jgi:GNAT superfamily N-acetyltransferase
MVIIAEHVELENRIRLHGSAPSSVKTVLGMDSARIGGGVALSMLNDPSGGYWRKALGFGLTEPLTADIVAEVSGFYRSRSSPNALLQVAPSVLPPDWDDICTANGITGGQWLIKLACEARHFVPGGSDLRVRPVRADERLTAARVLHRSVGMPTGMLEEIFAAASAGDDIDTFAAWDGEEMVAVSRLFRYGDSAEFAGCATLPSHRGRGAQSALLAARAQAAIAAGVRWFITEIDRPDAGENNPSLNNMRRAGFQPLYERRNWIWNP